VVSFDAAVEGTAAAAWDAADALSDRPQLSLDGVRELLVVAAHPDDETLGAAGLIAVCVERGIPVTIVVVTDGAAAGAADQASLADTRAAEAVEAARVLGARLIMLGLTDGATREHRAEVRAALEPVIGATSIAAMIAVTWRGDGHRDHRVVGEVVSDLVAGLAGARRLVEYPVWMWHWADPRDNELPWDDLAALPIDEHTKRRALGEYRSQTSGDDPVLRAGFLENFRRGTEYFFETAATASRPVHEPSAPPTSGTLDGAYFDATYERRDDPWGFETRWYEERKRALTLAILPDATYPTALEIGCSIGVLTEGLAARCPDLLAVDVSQAAVDRARERLGSAARVERRDVLHDFPAGTFDLIVLSEVGYYFSSRDLRTVLNAIVGALAPGGTLVACHWRHPVADYPLDGDTVHAAIGNLGLASIARHLEHDFVLEVLSRDDRSIAQKAGLA